MYASEGFSHRRNADGSFDSICRKCFRTAASSLSEPELEAGEKEHNCDRRNSILMISRWRTEIDLSSRFHDFTLSLTNA